ncbi:hypothetical protein M9458_044280, partial [Cirrhinus mrigala]
DVCVVMFLSFAGCRSLSRALRSAGHSRDLLDLPNPSGRSQTATSAARDVINT